MPISRSFCGAPLRGHLSCLLLGACVCCLPISYAEANGGGSSGSGGSGSGSGSSGSSGSGSSGGHGGPAGSMGSSSVGPGSNGGLPANGSASNGTGYGGNGHGSSSTSAHGTGVTHNGTMAVGKNAATHNQVVRNGFTSDTMLPRSPNRIRNRQISSRITSTGGFTPETYRKKKLKTIDALATKSATQSTATH
jgi:hypothetical protein